jgi:hypothetical protein
MATKKRGFNIGAYILAAEYAWSGVNNTVDQLPFKAEDLFLDLWSERKPILENRKGFLVDLKPVFNRRLSDDKDRSGWMGYGPDLDFSAFPVDRELAGQARFQPSVNEKGEGALLLAGKMNPAGRFPAEVALDLKGQKAASLHFLMNAGFRARKEPGRARSRWSSRMERRTSWIGLWEEYLFPDRRAGGDERPDRLGKARPGTGTGFAFGTSNGAARNRKEGGSGDAAFFGFGSRAGPVRFDRG